MSNLSPVDVIGGAVRAAGILHFESSATGGHALHRLPKWTQPQVADPSFALMQAIPSGCRLEMVTDATALELEVRMTMIQLGDAEGSGGAFDLVIDDELVTGVVSREGTIVIVDMETFAFDVQPGGSTTIRFDDLREGEKVVEIWLPTAAVVDLIALRANGAVAPAPATKPRWVHYGSSISHCLEAERPTGAWPAVAARLAGVDLQSLGFSGQCHLDGFVARTIRDLPADVISCKLGINVVNADSMRERTFTPALHSFIDTIREGHPDVPLMIVSPIYCPNHEAGGGPSLFRGQVCTSADSERPTALAKGTLTLQRIREIHAEVVRARRADGDQNLHLLSGLDLLGEADVGDLPDLLHPSPAGYQRMGERFAALAFGPGRPFAR